jgi:glycosyltransferase involved in cell wall biosynthesis
LDGTDGTAKILKRHSRGNDAPLFSIVDPLKGRGLGAAFRLGFAAVPDGAHAVVTMDADLNHKPEELKRLLVAFEAERADIFIGSRKVLGGEIPAWTLGGDG